MTCARCGALVGTIEHHFFEGLAPASRIHGERATREWTIVAPLYFKANADNTAMIEGYCGPVCATAEMRN